MRDDPLLWCDCLTCEIARAVEAGEIANEGNWENTDHLMNGPSIMQMWGGEAAITFFNIMDILQEHLWKSAE